MLKPILALATLLAAATSLAGQETDYRVLGSSDAPAEMLVYSDFECPYCRNFALAALPAIIAEFVHTGQLRIRYVYFPLTARHPNAAAAARAAHCAGLAGRFWSFHDYLFVRQPERSGGRVSDDLWVSYAANLGLDAESFASCMADEATFTAIDRDLRQALSSGATGTPTVVIAGESLSGITSYETLRASMRLSPYPGCWPTSS
jgi:protein-disulfide isomerase